MKNDILPELGISIGLIIILGTLLNPFKMGMSSSLHMALTILLALLAIAFIAFGWKELPADEREAHHRNKAGRIGYLAGTAILSAGIVFQSIEHAVDPWLIAGLGVMVLMKLVSLIVSKIIN